jgi:hypothetical protein
LVSKITAETDSLNRLQFTVKHEQNIDCGGGYAKLFDCSLDAKDMHGESPYLIMFGKTGPSLFKVFINNFVDNAFVSYRN